MKGTKQCNTASKWRLCHQATQSILEQGKVKIKLDQGWWPYFSVTAKEKRSDWFQRWQEGTRYHHHYVPSVVNRSAVMDLHHSRSCATLIQSLYDIFVHSLMLSVHIVLGLPRPLLPFILPSISNRCIPSPLIICPKYWHFLFLIVFNNDLLVFILCKTSALVLCSFHDILDILLYSHISKASNLSDVTLVSVHVSAPYKSVDQI